MISRSIKNLSASLIALSMLSLNVASKADTVSTAVKPSHIAKPSHSHGKHTGFRPKFSLGIGIGFTQPGYKAKVTEKSTIINESKQKHTELKQKSMLGSLYATVICQILSQISGDVQAGVLINGYVAFGGASSSSVSDDTTITSLSEAHKIETSNPFGAQVSFILQFNHMLGIFLGVDWSTFTANTSLESAKIDLNKLDDKSTIKTVLSQEVAASGIPEGEGFIETMTINLDNNNDPHRAYPLSFICGLLLKFKAGIGAFAFRGGIKVSHDIAFDQSSKFKTSIQGVKLTQQLSQPMRNRVKKLLDDTVEKINKESESCKRSYVLSSGVKPILDISYMAELN
jgi:hypothetical protein